MTYLFWVSNLKIGIPGKKYFAHNCQKKEIDLIHETKTCEGERHTPEKSCEIFWTAVLILRNEFSIKKTLPMWLCQSKSHDSFSRYQCGGWDTSPRKGCSMCNSYVSGFIVGICLYLKHRLMWRLHQNEMEVVAFSVHDQSCEDTQRLQCNEHLKHLHLCWVHK